MGIKEKLPEAIPSLAAVFYSKLPARLWRRYHQKIADEITLDEGFLLDVGTGPGILPKEIASRRKGLKVIGIALSRKMVEIAAKNRGKMDNLDFVLMDGNRMAFKDSSLDFIVSTGSLHHWVNPSRVLNEIHRCLKRNGRAWVYDGYADVSKEEIKDYYRGVSRIAPPTFLVRRILAIHGFTESEYRSKVLDIMRKSAFGGCSLEHIGLLMKITLQKGA